MKISRAEFKDPVPVPGHNQETTTYPKNGKLDFQNGILTWSAEGHAPTLIPAGNVKFMVPELGK